MPMPSEASSRGRRGRHRSSLRQGKYRLAEKAFSVTLARLHGPLETAGRQMPLRHPPPAKESPHVFVLSRCRHSYALFGLRLPYMRRKGTPRAYPDYVTAQTVAGIHAAFEMLPFFIWSGAEYRFDNINLTKVTLYLIHNHRKTPKEPMRTVTGAFSFPVFSCHIRM